ncbi:MAG: CHAT domain-containing protein [Novosphingobium sp.]|nr:CHAT domain-containing protein [Novosphingobium sp.]
MKPSFGGRVCIAGVAAAAFGLLASTPARALTADELCATSQFSAGTYPDDSTLQTQAAAIERAMSRGGGSASLQSVVTVEGASASSPPSEAALAQYCSAAGEAARTRSDGSQYQAHAYLVASLVSAERAGLRDVSALAAYRLGLVHASDGSGIGSRGMAGDVSEDASVAGRGADAACATLSSPGNSGMRGRAYSALALECSAGRALAAKDYRLSSMASLRLARLAIANPDLPFTAQSRPFASGLALQSIGTAESIPNGVDRATMIGRLVETALDAGSNSYARLDLAIGQMRTAASDDPAIAAFTAALEGRLAQATGGPANGHLQRAIQFESQRELPTRMPDWLLLLAQAEPDKRYEHVASAYRALETIRPFLPAVDPVTNESNFALRMREVFEAAVDAELNSVSGDDPDRIARAQTIIESYRQAEIQDLFGSDCAPSATPFTPSDLLAREVVLYPVVLDDRMELLYAAAAPGDSAPRFHRLVPRPVSRSEVDSVVAGLVSLGSRGHGSAWQGAAARLYELLIAPIENQLGGDSTLIIVPDSSLRAVPFAALVDGTGKYLVERTRMTVAPALSFLQPGDRAAQNEPNVVAAALGREVVVPGGVFPKLDFTIPEARAVVAAEQGDNSDVMVDFSKADLERVLVREPVDILHLATHAAFNGGSNRSFIVAADQLVRLSELRDLISARRTRGGDLALLVLSACETAVGDDEAAMGLAGAAIQAGAVSALASLWQVDDIGTAELMSVFYRGLREGKSRAEALRDAQLALIARNNNQSDPWIWSAFTMLGGWR